ncbi:MAG: hypothetical protein WCW84_07980 [Sulfurimonas sp.]|jgi:hypothetical protein
MGKLMYISVFVIGMYYYNHPERFERLGSEASVVAKEATADAQAKATRIISDTMANGLPQSQKN